MPSVFRIIVVWGPRASSRTLMREDFAYGRETQRTLPGYIQAGPLGVEAEEGEGGIETTPCSG